MRGYARVSTGAREIVKPAKPLIPLHKAHRWRDLYPVFYSIVGLVLGFAALLIYDDYNSLPLLPQYACVGCAGNPQLVQCPYSNVFRYTCPLYLIQSTANITTSRVVNLEFPELAGFAWLDPTDGPIAQGLHQGLLLLNATVPTYDISANVTAAIFPLPPLVYSGPPGGIDNHPGSAPGTDLYVYLGAAFEFVLKPLAPGVVLSVALSGQQSLSLSLDSQDMVTLTVNGTAAAFQWRSPYGSWTHLVVVNDNVASTAVYANGTRIGFTLDAQWPVGVTGRGTYTLGPILGEFDAVRFYDGPLTQQQVVELFTVSCTYGPVPATNQPVQGFRPSAPFSELRVVGAVETDQTLYLYYWTNIGLGSASQYKNGPWVDDGYMWLAGPFPWQSSYAFWCATACFNLGVPAAVLAGVDPQGYEHYVPLNTFPTGVVAVSAQGLPGTQRATYRTAQGAFMTSFDPPTGQLYVFQRPILDTGLVDYTSWSAQGQVQFNGAPLDIFSGASWAQLVPIGIDNRDYQNFGLGDQCSGANYYNSAAQPLAALCALTDTMMCNVGFLTYNVQVGPWTNWVAQDGQAYDSGWCTVSSGYFRPYDNGVVQRFVAVDTDPTASLDYNAEFDALGVVDVLFFQDLGGVTIPPVAIMAANGNWAPWAVIWSDTEPSMLDIYGVYGQDDADDVSVPSTLGGGQPDPVQYNPNRRYSVFWFLTPTFAPRSASVAYVSDPKSCQLNGAVFTTIPYVSNYSGGGSYAFDFELVSAPAYDATILLRSGGFLNNSISIHLSKPDNETQDSIEVDLASLGLSNVATAFNVTYPEYMAYQFGAPCTFGQACTIQFDSINTDLTFVIVIDGPMLFVSAYNGWFNAFFVFGMLPIGQTSGLSMTSTYSYACTQLTANFYD